MCGLGIAAGCSRAESYGEEARKTAAAIGADDLTVHDSISNFAANSGRTVRFTVGGDPIAAVSLPFLSVGKCRDGMSRAEVLRGNIEYARGQAVFAAKLAKAFAPCGFRGAVNISLNNAGLERQYQFASANLILQGTVPEGGEAQARTALLACVQTLATGIGNNPYQLDDVANWAARPLSLVISIGDYSGRPEAKAPLILGWQGTWVPKGRALIMGAMITDGTVNADGELRDDGPPAP